LVDQFRFELGGIDFDETLIFSARFILDVL
jgi:hypothetical protein